MENWKEMLPDFKEKTKNFYEGNMSMGDYKGFSGLYGSYAQKGGKVGMIRLRMSGGRITKDKMSFICSMIKKHSVDMFHFTTCEAVQLHNLTGDAIYDIMESALDHDIITMGGGGDFPRNVMCSPLSGVEPGEYFDVMPYALAAADYLMGFINQEKMPRKLKVCFSNSKANITHATYRDLGFAANENGKFDVYSAGGLGNNPRFGVLINKDVDPAEIYHYIKAMILTFRAHGNYENRGKARTRYMQESLGGADNYRNAFLEKLDLVKKEGPDNIASVTEIPVNKKGDGDIQAPNVIPQKQQGLYAVAYHPIGGKPDIKTFENLYETIKDMEAVELRLSGDETCYIINLTASEAKKVLDIIKEDNAATLFETSVSCIGATICQVGLRDSQGLLRACVDAVKAAGIKDGALPRINISGCPSSCGTHQTGTIGFRGAVKNVDGKPLPAFIMYAGGCQLQGQESMGEEIGTILEQDIPAFLVKLGKTVEAAGCDFETWYAQHGNRGIKF